MPSVRYSEDPKEYLRQYMKDRRQKWAAQGLCPHCGKEPVPGGVYCLTYLQTRRRYYDGTIRRKSIARVQQGRCSSCGEPGLVPGHVGSKTGYGLCQTCYLKRLAQKHLGSRKLWPVLLQKLEAQGHRCAYTGEPLILGQNDSIDHIMPRSQAPELAHDPANLEWVLFSINAMKSGRSRVQFLAIIQEIHRRCLGSH